MGFSLYNQRVHVTKNASEWLFDGYADPMIDLAKDNPLLDAGDIPFDRFGWFYMVSRFDNAFYEEINRAFNSETTRVSYSASSTQTRVSTTFEASETSERGTT